MRAGERPRLQLDAVAAVRSGTPSRKTRPLRCTGERAFAIRTPSRNSFGGTTGSRGRSRGERAAVTTIWTIWCR